MRYFVSKNKDGYAQAVHHDAYIPSHYIEISREAFLEMYWSTYYHE